jgi:putative phosphoesterase
VLIAVISDTHMPRRARTLPEACLARLRGADLIVHAGDHCDMDAVRALRALGRPVVTVHGNADDAAVRAALPAHEEIALPGLRLAVTHDAGPAAGRAARLRRRFPEAGLIVFGHSHIPLTEVDADGVRILNPGSPTDRRRQPHHTMATVRLAGDAPAEVTIHALGVD